MPTPTTVADVMQRELHTLGRNDKLSVAEDLMRQERIRHMPVIDADGGLAGILSQRDLFRGALLRALGYGGRAEQMMLDVVAVKEAMREEVITTTPGTALVEAARAMIEHGVGCLPVIDGDRLVGILTEGDFVRIAARSTD